MNLAKHHAKALRAKRRGKSAGFIALVEEGEKARAVGSTEKDCPYAVGSDERDAWLFGLEG